jgi:hypothetical protein
MFFDHLTPTGPANCEHRHEPHVERRMVVARVDGVGNADPAGTPAEGMRSPAIQSPEEDAYDGGRAQRGGRDPDPTRALAAPGLFDHTQVWTNRNARGGSG